MDIFYLANRVSIVCSVAEYGDLIAAARDVTQFVSDPQMPASAAHGLQVLLDANAAFEAESALPPIDPSQLASNKVRRRVGPLGVRANDGRWFGGTDLLLHALCGHDVLVASDPVLKCSVDIFTLDGWFVCRVGPNLMHEPPLVLTGQGDYQRAYTPSVRRPRDWSPTAELIGGDVDAAIAEAAPAHSS